MLIPFIATLFVFLLPFQPVNSFISGEVSIITGVAEWLSLGSVGQLIELFVTLSSV